MSYILDALRKADAQRERDSSRGIHAHPAPLGAAASNGAARPPWIWGAVAAAIVVAAAGGWYMSRSEPAVAPVHAPVAATAPQPRPALNPAPAIMPAAPAIHAGVPPATGARVIAPPARPHSEMPLPQPGGMAVPPPPEPPRAQAAAPSAIAGLPADAPHVAISGGVYSPAPAQRMLIVGGQVFSEGSEIAPGLTVDEIKPRTAILRFRGTRYTVAY